MNTVQNEQTGDAEALTGHTQEAPTVLPADEEVVAETTIAMEEDEPQYVHEHVILPEDMAVPDELADEEIDEETLSEATDYSQLSKEELVSTAEKLVKEGQIEAIRVDIENIKIQFYKKHKSELERLRKQFLDEGGNPEDFKPQPDGLEEKLKALLKEYKEAKAEYTRKAEAEKMDVASLMEVAGKYKDAIVAKQGEFDAISKKLAAIPPVEKISAEAQKLTEDAAKLTEAIKSLKERFDVYVAALKAKGGDASKLAM